MDPIYKHAILFHYLCPASEIQSSKKCNNEAEQTLMYYWAFTRMKYILICFKWIQDSIKLTLPLFISFSEAWVIFIAYINMFE